MIVRYLSDMDAAGLGVCHQLADLTDIPDLVIESSLDAYVPGGLYREVMQKWDKRTPGGLKPGDAAPEAPVWTLSDPTSPMQRVNLLQHFRKPGRPLVLNFGSYRCESFDCL